MPQCDWTQWKQSKAQIDSLKDESVIADNKDGSRWLNTDQQAHRPAAASMVGTNMAETQDDEPADEPSDGPIEASPCEQIDERWRPVRMSSGRIMYTEVAITAEKRAMQLRKQQQKKTNEPFKT